MRFFHPLCESLQVFPWAWATGLLCAAACAALGVYVVLRRVVFIGVALSEAAALGVALALAWQWPPLLGAGGCCLLAVGLLARRGTAPPRLPREAVLGMVYAGAAAGAVLLVAHSAFGLNEVKTLLYGDLILAGPGDCASVLAAVLPVVGLLAWGWRSLRLASFDPAFARVMGVRVAAWELAFFLVLGWVLAGSTRPAGALLVFAYLVCPAATGLLLSRSLARAMMVAVIAAMLATGAGLWLSLACDWPTNPTIILLLCLGAVLAGVAGRWPGRGQSGAPRA